MMSVPIAAAVFLSGQAGPVDPPLPAGAVRRLGSAKLRHPGDPAETFFSPGGKSKPTGGSLASLRAKAARSA